jgi:hypothetical protein
MGLNMCAAFVRASLCCTTLLLVLLTTLPASSQTQLSVAALPQSNQEKNENAFPIGGSVLSKDGELVGVIDDVIAQETSTKIVIGLAGYLGVGEKDKPTWRRRGLKLAMQARRTGAHDATP